MVVDLIVPRDLPFVVIGLPPNNKVWAAFRAKEDAERFARLVPYGRVVKATSQEEPDVEQR